MIDRRTFLAAAAATAAPLPLRAATPAAPALSTRFERIRATLGAGARIGVAAIDTASGRTLGHDANARYATASTFKLPLAAAVLAQADRGALSLDDPLEFAPGDPLSHSPVVAANLARGRLDIRQLCAAIVRVSDNSAANLLMRRIGGPEALTRFFRACRDPVTRIDRYELELNSNLPGDPRDTTSPLAMARLVRSLVLGEVLTPASRSLLTGWLETSEPGPDRLRAGLPADWRFGHKTGTGARGAHNDVGIAWPPGRAPIVISSYQSGGDAPPQIRAAAHASVARLVAETFA